MSFFDTCVLSDKALRIEKSLPQKNRRPDSSFYLAALLPYPFHETEVAGFAAILEQG